MYKKYFYAVFSFKKLSKGKLLRNLKTDKEVLQLKSICSRQISIFLRFPTFPARILDNVHIPAVMPMHLPCTNKQYVFLYMPNRYCASEKSWAYLFY